MRATILPLLGSVFLHSQAALAATFLLPLGPYNTTLTTHQLINTHHLDPYAPTPTPRSLMISLFVPSLSTCNAVPTPYMDPITAAWVDTQYADYGIPAGTFESLNLQVCPPAPDSKTKYGQHRRGFESWENRAKGHWPVLLFSPGLGNPRGYYSAIAQDVASQGYVVVLVDHTYDAGIVVFPDNSTIFAANITTDEQIVQDLDVRVQDMSLVLEFLEKKHGFDTTKVGIFGHSLGGATAASAILTDCRFAGGVNLDGTFFGPLASPNSSAEIRRPFMIFAHEGKNTTTDPSWAAIWPKIKGWKRLLELQGSAHGTFTDLPDVIDVLGLSGLLPPEVGELLGAINGGRALTVIGTYVGAYFDLVLKGKRVELLDGPSKSFPEVGFEEVKA